MFAMTFQIHVRFVERECAFKEFSGKYRVTRTHTGRAGVGICKKTRTLLKICAIFVKDQQKTRTFPRTHTNFAKNQRNICQEWRKKLSKILFLYKFYITIHRIEYMCVSELSKAISDRLETYVTFWGWSNLDHHASQISREISKILKLSLNFSMDIWWKNTKWYKKYLISRLILQLFVILGHQPRRES